MVEKEMRCGCIDLRGLFNFIKQNAKEKDIFNIQKTGEFLREFANPNKEKIGELTKDIPKAGGWYIWIKLDGSDYKIIYVGKASAKNFPKSETGTLQYRLRYELDFEYVPAVLKTLHGERKTKDFLRSLYPRKDYEQFLNRAMRKEETTHIIWIKNKDRNLIEKVELYLIGALNSEANNADPEKLGREVKQMFDTELKKLKL